MSDSDTRPDFDLLAASIRADSTDLRTYLEVVAAKLADALPGSVKIEREGGIFTRTHRVRRVTLNLDGRAYALEWTGTDLRASIDAGPVAVDRWALALGRHLEEHASAETQSRAAMEALLEGRLPVQELSRPDPQPMVARHPATSFSPDSVLDVEPVDSAVLLSGGAAIGPIAAGRHRVGDLIPGADPAATAVKGTLYFVSVAERQLRFGGVTGGVRAYGVARIRVSDPVELVGQLGAPAGAQITDELVAGILRDLTLKALSEVIASDAGGAASLADRGTELAAATLERLRAAGPAGGLEVLAFQSLAISPAEVAPSALPPASQGCPRCGAENSPGSRFCAQCGAQLPLA